MLMRVAGATDFPAGGSVRVTEPAGTESLTSCSGLFRLVKPACSSCRVAWSRVRPLTGGTATGAGPDDTRIVTVDPTAAFVPGFGMLLKTVPLGAAFGWSVAATTKPRFLSSVVTSAAVRPVVMSNGIVFCDAPLLTNSVTVDPRETLFPPAGSWFTTVSTAAVGSGTR